MATLKQYKIMILFGWCLLSGDDWTEGRQLSREINRLAAKHLGVGTIDDLAELPDDSELGEEASKLFDQFRGLVLKQ